MSLLTSGQILDSRFTLVHRLGRGGMGDVWLADDEELGEEVVVKVLPPDADEERIALLRRECSHARRLIHPNIVRVFEFHRSEAGAFITMARADGSDLRGFRGRPPAEVIGVMLPVIDALRYAHERGVVHRDLKPGNIVCDSSGTPCLLDFGIAGFEESTQQVQGGGARSYASPQQLAGAPPSPADDLYGLGALIHDLLTGRPPGAESSASLPPGRLGLLVGRLIAPRLEDRLRDLTQVEQELREILRDLAQGSSVAVTPPPRAQRIDPIAPALLGPAGDSPARRPRLSLVGGMILLVIATAIVLFLIPRMLPDRSPDAEHDFPSEAGEIGGPEYLAEEGPTVGGSPSDLGERVRLRRDAERALEEMTGLLRGLAKRGVERWGGDEYADAVALVAIGDERLGGTHYAAAAAAYREATSILTALTAGSIDLLRQTLDEGDACLAVDDARGAAESFELALAIEPQNLRAQRGTGRAAVLDRLLDLLANGAEAERVGDLERAGRHYRDAVELDPWSSRAEEALGRSQTLMRETRFTESMSGALDALEREDYAVARAAFEQAGALHPGSSQVAEGLARLDEAEKVDAIARHARRAEDYEGKEDWQPAFEEFEKVLGLDETIVFAQQGAARTARRVDLARAIDSLLAHPARLSDDDVLAEAELLLIDASEVAPAGPAHRSRVERLRRLVRSASTYVRVRLRSDSLTEVVVYRVGRLGTFDDRELELRPGRYTVVGSRRGYRDVRRELVVTAGAEPEPLVVRCEEPI